MKNKIRIILIVAAVLTGAAFGARILSGSGEEIITAGEASLREEAESPDGDDASFPGESDTGEHNEEKLRDEYPGQDSSSDASGEKSLKEPEKEPETIFVHVCGEVLMPAVYELPEGSRLYEAVNEAGGFAEDAAKDYLNLAGILSDGQRVYVPSLSDIEEGKVPPEAAEAPADPGKGTGKSEGPAGKVDLNRAGAEELMGLPGIGSAKASAIIAYREEKGPFSSIEEVMKVEGIKEGMFRRIKDLITVD
ncbi:MAG: helix-hairpin-helix domain-containing protein [Lachnospiraceae bacterium]|nr:helix-hairpin-helix domain-containing protein [Lachnospiraceae bacterium]